MKHKRHIVYSLLITLLAVVMFSLSCEKEKDKKTPPSENGGEFICGNELLDFRDLNVYSTVRIGEQCWMAENLAYLPAITYENDWGNHTEPQYAVYGYAPGSGKEDVTFAKVVAYNRQYGVLYNWAAAMQGSESSQANPSGVRGICPEGWHLPSDAEWEELENYLADNGYNHDGSTGGGRAKIAKSMASTGGWHSSTVYGSIGNDKQANNSSGFTALPGGIRSSLYGMFFYDGINGYWWSATETNKNSAWFRLLSYNISNVHNYSGDKGQGISIRCVKDKISTE